jgi:hypothetical protein
LIEGEEEMSWFSRRQSPFGLYYLGQGRLLTTVVDVPIILVAIESARITASSVGALK